MHLGVLSGNDSLVNLLPFIPEDVFTQDTRGRTPLHSAVLGGSKTMVKRLIGLGHGAAVHVRDTTGKTPLDYAAERNLDGVVQLLLQAAACLPPRPPAIGVSSPLHHAAQNAA